ncbi:MAG TPA: thiosulfohydrolase SoxB [Xanthobacteraceae bacterium]|nr:thiosulfohydrolase SoxB [Xanthobacteraceae bacterium]
MINRRDLIQAGAAAAAIIAGGRFGGFDRALAQQKLTQAQLLQFKDLGNVTLLHFADLHAQLLPVYLREPAVNIGFGESQGQPPHLSGREFLRHYKIAAKSPDAYALTAEQYLTLARSYGQLGGLDRLATAVKAIRAERGQDRVLLLDGGDSFQGSLASNRTKGQDVAGCLKLLKLDAATCHWEFTYGKDGFEKLDDALPYPFLGLNVKDAQQAETALDECKIFDKGGVGIAILGHAYPHTGNVHPPSVLPPFSFGLRERDVRAAVDRARRKGASLIVLLSHNGFDADRKLAANVSGIDIIFTAQSHEALPQPLKVSRTLLVASGSHGKFLSRLDLDVHTEGLRNFRYRLIPLFADAIAPDAEMAQAVARARAPYAAELARVVGQTESALYRRETIDASFDDLIGAAIAAERDAEIVFFPGYNWGPTLLPQSPITVEDIHAATAISYPEVYRGEVSGARIKEILEGAADGLCNADPYWRLGRGMLRCSGLGYRLDVRHAAGKRISALQLLRNGKPIEPERNYTVAGFGNVAERVEGPPAWEVVEKHVAAQKTVHIKPQAAVKVAGV